jgi:hypothetical protein
VRSHCTPAARDRIDAQLSSQFRSALTNLTPAGWSPRRHMGEILNALASTAGSEEARYQQLCACGEYINQRTTNEFTALVYGILTPELFVKKLPRFWQREHQGEARCVLDTGAEPGRASFTLVGVEGYDHIGVMWLGWMKGALGQMRSAGATLTQDGWSPGSPAPQAIRYEMSWS